MIVPRWPCERDIRCDPRRRRRGFPISVRLVDGLEWETPDHFQSRAADPERRRRLAEARDHDPERWSDRVRLAQCIIEEALAAAERPMEE